MAKSSIIKPSQLTRTGYTYQDLMCLRVLINWFHDPQKYQWISIEGNIELSNIKSLDDVICFTANGEYELYQVKFTIDSDRDDLRLDFDWLLKKRPKGTSLIQKWSTDLNRFGNSNVISIAKLITNRKPDTVLSNCLDGNKIDYNLVPDEIKAKVSAHLGGERKAIVFFENLIFEHSQQEIDDLELKLHDSLVPDHANNESWLQLLKTVERWATRKNEPAPDSKIYLEHIHEILSLGSKRTISQFFEVPGGYIPPADEFHKQILDRTAKSGCLVISGLPGMGKSTYLSFLTDQLIENKTPVIRHHYYLSPQFIGDRIAFTNAAQSLQSQIKTLYPFDFNNEKLDPQKLETWINKAADKAAESNETLVVIIDGDHLRMNVIGVVCPRTGEFFAIETSHSDTETFQAFLHEAKQTIEFTRPYNILILDNASWHKKKTLNFFGWHPKFLPPYSPDYNPIERIWNTMKAKWFNNYVCRDLQQLIDRLDQAILDIIDNPQKTQKTTSIGTLI